jgi:malate/lactate dehydrogenase
MRIWSIVSIDGLPLKSYCEQIGRNYKDDELFLCFWKAEEAAFDEFERRGNLSLSMATGIVAIAEAILRALFMNPSIHARKTTSITHV